MHTIINKIKDEHLKKIEQDDGREGCVDILLKHIHNDECLLIELKAPKVKIDKKAIDQVEGYKMALEKHLENTKIRSYCVSTELDVYVQGIQRTQPRDGYLYIFTWQQILDNIDKTYSHEIRGISNTIAMESGYKYLQSMYSGIFGSQSH